jgi:hypothetical protein
MCVEHPLSMHHSSSSFHLSSTISAIRKSFIVWIFFPSPYCSWFANIWDMIIFLHICAISCFVTKIIAFVAYNILIHQWIKWIVIFVERSTNIFISTIFTIHVACIVIPFIDSTIDCLVSKISTSITMSKKEILILHLNLLHK